MYKRLWWKDARQFWPIWVFLAATGLVIQLGMDGFASPATRGATLVPMAMGLACLYAYATGAAAFAGERETGTLRLLDILPAPRAVVWAGKTSFALTTTAALALVLLAMAGLDATPHPGQFMLAPDHVAAVQLVTLIVEALALGLLCSALFSSALSAAVIAIALTGAFRFLTLRITLGTIYGPQSNPTPWDLGLTLAAFAGSWLIFLAGSTDLRPRSPRLPFALRFRSPVEVAWAGGSTQETERPRVPVAAASRGIAAGAVAPIDRRRPRSRMVELRHLTWQAIREGRPTWLFLIPMALIASIPMYSGVPVDPIILVSWNVLIALAAGVSVFGLENRHRTHRFPAHHGAKPGLVWASKLAAWSLGLAILWGPQMFAFYAPTHFSQLASNMQQMAWRGILIVPMFFAAAVLCGMAIPRGITAGVVALVIGLVLGVAEGVANAAGLLPTWGMIVLPGIFVAASWFWSGDWLLDRTGPARWGRLAGTLAGLLGIAFVGYTADRAWGIPDVGLIVPLGLSASAAPIPDELNAAPLYRAAADRAFNSFKEIEVPAIAHDDNWAGKQYTFDLGKPVGREIEKLVQRALQRPECQFVLANWLAMHNPSAIPVGLRDLGNAFATRAALRLEKGDLAGSWDDLMTDLRMARQIGRGSIVMQQINADSIERQALGVAGHWANAPGQSADRLHAAMADLRGLTEAASPLDIVRSEGLAIERALDLPVDDLRSLLLEEMSDRRRGATMAEALVVNALTTPWEIARARRLNRSITAEVARLAAIESWQRPADWRQGWLLYRRRGVSLLELFGPAYEAYLWNLDAQEAERRGLLTAMAVREWAFRHDGRFPERLLELTDEILPALPIDPYNGHPFGYLPLSTAKLMHPQEKWPERSWPEGSRLVYSIGRDGQDDHGKPQKNGYVAGDRVFPIAPVPAGKK